MAVKKPSKRGDYDLLPRELLDYFQRIGADVLSFRKAMVKTYSKGNKYYVERTMIKINPDGTVNCSNKEHEPSDQEKELIARAMNGRSFPKSINATKAGFETWRSKQGGNKARFFPLYDRRDGLIKMVQERVPREDGTKDFYPHTFWDDGEWRAMEPEGLLPIYKPEKGEHSNIMIHEGCKAAKFVDDLVKGEGWKAHPWGAELIKYDHWGMIGGALSPHRTDYDEIRRETPDKVIYVCDNDFAGTSALQVVSRCYGGPLTGIMFGAGFSESWDMANDFPEEMFSAKNKRYIGPSLRSLMQPATWATELVAPEGGKGRPIAVLRPTFKEEWRHVVKPEVYVHEKWPSELYTPPEFNNRIAPFSDVDDTARLLRKDAGSKGLRLKYDPGRKSGIYGDEGRYINTHVPSDIKPEEGDETPWLNFMEMLIPEECDRKELMRWCATLIARPEIKMHYGVLLISEMQGVGKGTLGEKILAPLMGLENVSYPNENEIVEGNFNYWLAHKRLAVVHEIYAGHSSRAYNKLKSVITDKTLTVSKKYMANYDIENWIHIFACSNSMRAIQLSADDRRWFVPKLTEEKQGSRYWTEFNGWLNEEGGLSIIKRWASEWLEKNSPVFKGDSAPWSKTKETVVQEGYSPGMQLVASFLDKASAEKNGGAVVLDTALVQMIKDFIYAGRTTDRLERPLTVRKVAKAHGWCIHPEQYPVSGATHTRALVSEPKFLKLPIFDLLKSHPPLDVNKLAVGWFADGNTPS